MKRFFSFMIAILMAITLTIPAPVLAAESGEPVNSWEPTIPWEPENIVWLHVVNGNFVKGSSCESIWEGNQNTGKFKQVDISDLPSVPIVLGEDRTLPNDVSSIQVTRTNGTFDGWYTKAPSEALEERGSEGSKYSVWKTEHTNGVKIKPGEGKVPDGVRVLYAAFNDKDSEDDDKFVEFYLDWNGINGMWGKCLTCSRKFNEGQVTFTADDAAVYNLNFKAEFDGIFSAANGSTAKWECLNEICQENDFNGYKFLGWSTEPTGNNIISEDTPVKNGMSFYAHWTKGNESSENFQRVDPAAGPLTNIRIVDSASNSYPNISKHAAAGENISLGIFRTPVRAEARNVTWHLTITKAAESYVEVFKPEKKEITVSESDSSDAYEGLRITAKGNSLAIENEGGVACSINVGVEATSKDDKVITAPANATVGFVHYWNQGVKVQDAACEQVEKTKYECTVDGCTATKELTTGEPLGHDMQPNGTCSRCDKFAPDTDEDKGQDPSPVPDESTVSPGTSADPEAPANPGTSQTPTTSPADPGTSQTPVTPPASVPSTPQGPSVEDTPSMLPGSSAGSAAPVQPGPSVEPEPSEEPEPSVEPEAEEKPESEEHVWGDWKTTTVPTLKSTGTEVRVCSVCGETETETLAMLTSKGMQEVGDSGEKVYVKTNGKLATGLTTVKGKKYYFNKKGIMQTGFQKIKGKKYYFKDNGVMKTGWKKINGKKYYFNSKGVMLTGKQKINGKTYTFRSNGVLKK